ncbi:MAG: hypothetical protein AAGA75_25560 [Cyanobacteria bacterium P01_E01_bin.6]
MVSNSVTQLLKSENPVAQVLGAGCAALFFFPAIAEIMDNPSLTLWGRLGRASTATGQLLLTVGAAGIDPKAFGDSDDDHGDGRDGHDQG